MNKLYILLILSIVSFFSYGIITKNNSKTTKKEKRLPCQTKTVTFEKINKKEHIKKAVGLLQSGNYYIDSYIEYSKFMESKIAKYLDISKANKLLEKSIKASSKSSIQNQEKLQIKYYIYENDKEDKGKKSKKAKLYAGYLVFEFLLNKKTIYKIQTDYMKMDTSDIQERMDCVIKSFITLKKD